MDAKRTAPKDWTRALDRSRADLAAGRVVDGAGVRGRLRGSIERMAAKLDPEPQPELDVSSVESVRR